MTWWSEAGVGDGEWRWEGRMVVNLGSLFRLAVNKVEVRSRNWAQLVMIEIFSWDLSVFSSKSCAAERQDLTGLVSCCQLFVYYNHALKIYIWDFPFSEIFYKASPMLYWVERLPEEFQASCSSVQRAESQSQLCVRGLEVFSLSESRVWREGPVWTESSLEGPKKTEQS